MPHTWISGQLVAPSMVRSQWPARMLACLPRRRPEHLITGLSAHRDWPLHFRPDVDTFFATQEGILSVRDVDHFEDRRGRSYLDGTEERG